MSCRWRLSWTLGTEIACAAKRPLTEISRTPMMNIRMVMALCLRVDDFAHYPPSQAQHPGADEEQHDPTRRVEERVLIPGSDEHERHQHQRGHARKDTGRHAGLGG